MTFLLNQLILAFFNFVNSRIDAYRILKGKTIAHAINLSAYAVAVGILIVLFKMNWPNSILFCFSAFFNRQLSFDIPLNLRRGLSAFYQSTANPPAAWWDRVERTFFPDNNGKKIVLFYSIMWCVTVGINLSFFVK
jgi:hypothetical protein